MTTTETTPRLIAISSGKGGVGKSTVTANIAVAMAQAGLRVGVVDADIYGPSIPGMLGIASAPPAMTPEGRVIPARAHGVRVISMGMLTDDDRPAILRGPMVSKYLQMFVRQVDWGPLDVLLLDLPPGTGDIQLTLAQAFPLSGAVVVSTPQDVSLKIARRGLRMMEQVNVPILGVVENMSGFTCPSCGTVTHIFHQGGGERVAAELGVPFLGRIPLDPSVVDCGDAGRPVVLTAPDSPAATACRDIATKIAAESVSSGGIATPFSWTPGQAESPAAPVAPGPDTPPGALCGIEIRPEALTLTWGDGRRQTIPARDLRLACGCARCKDEMTGARLLLPETVPLDVHLTRVHSVGNYALGLAFSDGHDTGIHTFASLREMSEPEVEDV
ncbi:ATP-binding protein involved in chromosome partitioning [Albidovulum inexpectatum]|uniref:Iron-sulfur cluster carrier protein n=1 Tax=Albidovulum inexpectatum TaxID=196587 RepID=A0A2S5JF92_9RHOB|nr:P-loop NTPase [Albidovulum inexpectatum]PPB79975.1 ATP-binding protein involved in chromosome partitioning [Albidovulum inexpectatum]